MIAPKRPYFAYGLNMVLDEMAHRCPASNLAGTAALPGFQFAIVTPGYASVLAVPHSIVHGLLWDLDKADETSLDRFEGVDIGNYTKEYRRIELENGVALTALVYVATDTAPGIPRRGYLERIVAAADSQGFPGAYVRELQDWFDNAASR